MPAPTRTRPRLLRVALYLLACLSCLGAGLAIASHLEPDPPPDTEALARTPGRLVALGPDLVVNVQGSDGAGLVRAGISLRLAKLSAGRVREAEGRGGRRQLTDEAQVRDIVLSVLGRESARGLSRPAGRQALKRRIIRRIGDEAGLRVLAVHFTAFLVV